MEETKVIYHIDDEETPYLVKIPISPDKLVSADGSNQSDGGSQCTDSVTHQSETRLPPPAPESVCTDTESIISSRQGRRHHKYSSRINGHLPRVYETASIAMSRTSSYSSITDSTMSLNIITVTLNMDTVNFLGISIVGQSNKGGDGGIYVGSIMKGGAVALDGRIEPGDMILQVNDVNFENMSNDEAVKVLREVVQKPGPIKLVVAKCWDPNPKGYFTIPRTEPVRPIDPGKIIMNIKKMVDNRGLGGSYSCSSGDPLARPPSSSTVSSSSIASTIPANERECLLGPDLEVPSLSILPCPKSFKPCKRPDSGLEIRDRMWLKNNDPERVHRHRHDRLCYYIFGDLCSAMSNMKMQGDTDSVGPLPNVPNYMPYSGTYNPLEYMPMPFYSENTVYGYNKEESVLSGSDVLLIQSS
ncbi:hypothetical protein NQ317_005447 [Molorchus minor]|uniref:PDZ domain-containing protein n=1 Tax=Molorchus minor TaxID=1323400 RepID=A0ABQ9IUN4_9CUCU|nr:hypothetical protein NQ317_005447 [Molorchus minor]